MEAPGSSGGPVPASISRRTVLQAVGFSVLALVPAPAQENELWEAAQKMKALTGAELPDRWAEPTVSLLGVIVGYSAGLRAIDLGQREPATQFLAG